MNNYNNEIFSNSILSKVVQITMVKFERHIFNEKKKKKWKKRDIPYKWMADRNVG